MHRILYLFVFAFLISVHSRCPEKSLEACNAARSEATDCIVKHNKDPWLPPGMCMCNLIWVGCLFNQGCFPEDSDFVPSPNAYGFIIDWCSSWCIKVPTMVDQCFNAVPPLNNLGCPVSCGNVPCDPQNHLKCQSCDIYHQGYYCAAPCSSNCLEGKCFQSGECFNGCSEGYTGINCDTPNYWCMGCTEIVEDIRGRIVGKVASALFCRAIAAETFAVSLAYAAAEKVLQGKPFLAVIFDFIKMESLCEMFISKSADVAVSYDKAGTALVCNTLGLCHKKYDIPPFLEEIAENQSLPNQQYITKRDIYVPGIPPPFPANFVAKILETGSNAYNITSTGYIAIVNNSFIYARLGSEGSFLSGSIQKDCVNGTGKLYIANAVNSSTCSFIKGSTCVGGEKNLLWYFWNLLYTNTYMFQNQQQVLDNAPSYIFSKFSAPFKDRFLSMWTANICYNDSTCLLPQLHYNYFMDESGPSPIPVGITLVEGFSAYGDPSVILEFTKIKEVTSQQDITELFQVPQCCEVEDITGALPPCKYVPPNFDKFLSSQ